MDETAVFSSRPNRYRGGAHFISYKHYHRQNMRVTTVIWHAKLAITGDPKKVEHLGLPLSNDAWHGKDMTVLQPKTIRSLV